MRAGEIFVDLLVLAMLADDFFELGMLLGEFLETRGIADDLGRGEFGGHLLVASVELIKFFGKRENGHGGTSFSVISFQFKARK